MAEKQKMGLLNLPHAGQSIQNKPSKIWSSKASPTFKNIFNPVDFSDYRTYAGGLIGRQFLPEANKGGLLGIKSALGISIDFKVGDSLSKAARIVGKRKNIDPKFLIDEVILPISHHESGGTYNRSEKQKGGGTAIGAMQFEPHRFKTSIERAKKVFSKANEELPKWLSNIKVEDGVSALTTDQQQALALYDLLEHGRADLTKVWDGKQSIADFWASNWWQGDEKDRKERISSFNRSLEDFKERRKNGQ